MARALALGHEGDESGVEVVQVLAQLVEVHDTVTGSEDCHPCIDGGCPLQANRRVGLAAARTTRYHAGMPLPVDLLPEPLPANPLELAAAWLALATQRADQPNPDAMTLATVDRQGRPSARIVLCKEIVPEPGWITFYTNYGSRKGRELAANPRAAVVLHFDHLHRQVRIEGLIARSPGAESDAYFATRPWQRRIGAWASAQSEPVATRALLVEAVRTTAARFGTPVPGPERGGPDPGVHIPRPPQWGGYRLYADAVELWVEGESRIHDRARWTRVLRGPKPATGDAIGATGVSGAAGLAGITYDGDGAGIVPAGPWTAQRLQP
jgi:pyridoxamine 5'-phosphate oxidase